MHLSRRLKRVKNITIYYNSFGCMYVALLEADPAQKRHVEIMRCETHTHDSRTVRHRSCRCNSNMRSHRVSITHPHRRLYQVIKRYRSAEQPATLYCQDTRHIPVMETISCPLSPLLSQLLFVPLRRPTLHSLQYSETPSMSSSHSLPSLFLRRCRLNPNRHMEFTRTFF